MIVIIVRPTTVLAWDNRINPCEGDPKDQDLCSASEASPLTAALRRSAGASVQVGAASQPRAVAVGGHRGSGRDGQTEASTRTVPADDWVPAHGRCRCPEAQPGHGTITANRAIRAFGGAYNRKAAPGRARFHDREDLWLLSRP